MSIFWAILLFLLALGFWSLTFFGLPGNWLIVGAAAIYAWCAPAAEPGALWWSVVIALLVLAACGEVIEFLAGSLGAAQSGGSKRGAVLALAGSLVGAIAGAVIGFPVPVVGPVIGILLFASGGALAGAMLGEQWKGRDLQHSWQVGKAAFWGRLLGTLGKSLCGSVMVALLLLALVISHVAGAGQV